MAIVGDNPIKSSAEDALGRATIAANLAAEIREVDASEGCVIAVIGPWGSGKTSLINLVRHELEKQPIIPVLDFNPWLFSGAEQLVESFFRELSAQLRLKGDRFSKIATDIQAYGDLFSPLAMLPVVGAWFSRVRDAASAVNKFQEQRKESVVDRRKKIAQELSKLDQRIVVIIDDIDRLNTDEIRDIFKLVRLTASFPNIVYVLAFDRARVEDALTETGLIGRNYLEKIVQVSVNVPDAPEGLLLNQLGRAIGAAFEDVSSDDAAFDEKRWPDVLVEIVRPLIRNMRDVRRYAASARGTVRALNGQVELVDILGLEAVRIFNPDLFTAISQARVALTSTRSYSLMGEPAIHKTSIDHILEIAGSDRPVALAAISRLFPAGGHHTGEPGYGPEWRSTWLEARRVAHPDVLALYLERTVNDGLAAFDDAQRALEVLADESAFASFIQSVDADRREDVIAALEAYEGDYPVEAVPSATVVLLNILPDLPERPRGFLSTDTRIVVTRVVLRLLQQLNGEDEVGQAVSDVLPRLNSMSSQLELVRLVGHTQGSGHGLVTADKATQLELNLRSAVRAAPPASLADEWSILYLLYWAYCQAPQGGVSLQVIDDAELNVQLLLDARSEIRKQAHNSRSIQREVTLSWDTLVEIYGGEEHLREAITAARSSASLDPLRVETIELAEKYLTGWRPKQF